MGVMTAVGWIGAFFLLAVIIRAKIKPIGNMLVPACLIGGVIGCVIINTVGLPWTTTADYSLISGQMYNFMFINLGITVAAKAEEKKRDKRSFSIRELRRKMGDSQLSGIFGMGSYWALAYAFQALIGFGILYLIGGIWDMDPVYGLTISFAFAQGPGQAVTFGSGMEAAGWTGAIQVGIMFSAIGFIVAFLLGVPFAKKGIKQGIACSKAEMSEELRVGFFPPEKQETYGKITTYGGNLDTMTFHLALTGLCWICGKVLCIFLDKIQIGSGMTLGSTIFFFWGMVAAYMIRFLMGKLGLHKYLDRGTQTRITNACTDLMVMATFLAIDLQFLAKWLVPIAIISMATTWITWVTIRYFGARFGGRNDFERTLAEWGTATGTNATGLALTRIVDPNNDTTTAAELGPSNAVNLPASLYVMPAILAYSAGTMGLKLFLITMILVIVIYLVFMRVVGVWGKKTFDINKGEKYQDGKCYQRMGEPVDE
ncbi:sodium:glutamate symporter [Pusillibacter faecalis]|uniref:sodium:glutamate symporter n=1 Tax=Pusillibacter faecalis TaxID=2714358 RepID=UPI00210A709B|nr:sodium:glutamate symporter [Pusillibacter faecalis]